MIPALLSYLPVIALALGIETLVVAAVTARGRRRQPVRACLALNLLTHPLGTLLVWHTRCDPLQAWLLELSIEWIGYTWLLRVSTARAFAMAALADVCAGAATMFVWSSMTGR